MRPRSVSSGLLALMGSRAWVERVPLGVVGIISPWNFPVGLALQPLAQAFAGGNRAMIKVSEFTPATGALLEEVLASAFAKEEVMVFTGGPDVGAAFSRLPFDLLFFTGATGIARHIQRAAAENLVPVVLELGGKSPVVVAPDADFALAADRIAAAKQINAGQLCLSPDYVFVPVGREREFTERYQAAMTRMLPTLLENPDYTSIVARRHYERLLGYLDDARAKGATILEINPAGEDFARQAHHKLPPTVLLGATPDMKVMQEEIFGPLLPVVTYQSIDEVITFVNARPRPLATYYFGQNNATCRQYLDRTVSGGVTINDCLLHVANEDLPFGGVGESGMGYYHGKAGFDTFTHPRAIVRAPRWSPNKLMAPPYGPKMQRLMNWFIDREAKNAAARIARSRR